MCSNKKPSTAKNNKIIKQINLKKIFKERNRLHPAVTREDLEKAMAPHSSTLAWKIPWVEEPGRLQSMGSLRVRHN